MAIALRPRPRASTISARYGSQALALGARPGGAGGLGSVDTRSGMAGFGAPGSVDTAVVVAGFGGHTPGRPPRSRTGIPPLSGRRSPFRDGRPSPAQSAAGTSPIGRGCVFAVVSRRPRRCSCLRRNICSSPASTSRPSAVVAGFQVSINGRFWVSTEGGLGAPPRRCAIFRRRDVCWETTPSCCCDSGPRRLKRDSWSLLPTRCWARFVPTPRR